MQCGSITTNVGHPYFRRLGAGVDKRVGQCLNGDVVDKCVCRFRNVRDEKEPQGNPPRSIAGESDIVVLPSQETGGYAGGHRHERGSVGGIDKDTHLHTRGRVAAMGVARHFEAEQQAVEWHAEFRQYHQQLRCMRAVACE